jgi:threonine dehydratase
MDGDYLQRILKARVYEVAIESPLEHAPRLSRRLGHELWLKREDLQPVFSFKLRGAFNKIAHLDAAAAERGVITASAGNHAQGVALAAQRRGIRALVVMPVTTPAIKVRAVADLGGEVVLHGDLFDAAFEHAQALSQQQRLTFVHPFDDDDVIAGQGTIGVEIMRQAAGEPDAIFVPVGGGGLISGIASYVKALHPRVRIVGVEPADSAAMHDSLRAGKRVTLERVGLFADGVAVRRVGERCFELARRHVDEVLRVDTDEICGAIQDVYEDTRTVLEPAGALAVAGVKRYAARGVAPTGQHFVAINSGANLNFDRLRYIAERADLGAGREALLAIDIPEQRGSFLRFCGALGEHSVTEFNYRHQGTVRAQLFVGFALREGAEDRAAVIARLTAAGYGVVDMSGNEMAKLHVRYMIGGVGRGLADEVLFRFEFPERPGALRQFLEAIGDAWNITLFHYRNHGSDYGRVLAGIQVPAGERAEFLGHLRALGYPYTEETANPAYRNFLAA